MSKAPLCRYCGKPIAKRTRTIWFEREPTQYWTAERGYVFFGDAGRPQTKAEAQRYVNQKVVSVQRGAHNNKGELQDGIASAGIWDGESYVDEFFCNGNHAKWFGRLMAKAGHCTQAFVKAWRALDR